MFSDSAELQTRQLGQKWSLQLSFFGCVLCTPPRTASSGPMIPHSKQTPNSSSPEVKTSTLTVRKMALNRTQRPQSSSFWGLPYRMRHINPQKELLWGLRVSQSDKNNGMQRYPPPSRNQEKQMHSSRKL